MNLQMHTRSRSWVRRTLALLLLPAMALAGCYRTVPFEGEPQPGTRVVVSLTDAGRGALHDVIGADMVRVEGETAAVTPDRWNLLMLTSWNITGREVPWFREPVSFPATYISRVELRRFDRRRTLLAATAATAVVVVLGRGFVKGWGGGPDESGGEQPGH